MWHMVFCHLAGETLFSQLGCDGNWLVYVEKQPFFSWKKHYMIYILLFFIMNLIPSLFCHGEDANFTRNNRCLVNSQVTTPSSHLRISRWPSLFVPTTCTAASRRASQRCTPSPCACGSSPAPVPASAPRSPTACRARPMRSSSSNGGTTPSSCWSTTRYRPVMRSWCLAQAIENLWLFHAVQILWAGKRNIWVRSSESFLLCPATLQAVVDQHWC